MSNTPKLSKMASGNLSLLITDDVSWESFPEKASDFVKRHKGIVLRKTDTPFGRVWVVVIRWRPFWLTFEDYPLGLSLDSMSRFCNAVVQDIYEHLSLDQAV